MVRLFLCALLLVCAACPKEEAAAEKTSGGCRVKLPPPPIQWADPPLYESASPRLVVSYSSSGFQEESEYQLYWQQPDGLYHATRGRSGALIKDPQKLLSLNGAWEVVPYQNNALLVFLYERYDSRYETRIALAYLNGVEPPTKLIVLPELRTPQEVAIAVQGQAAAVAYTVITEEGPKAFVHLVDLSYFSEDGWQLSAETPITNKNDLSRGFSEVKEASAKPAPVSLSAVDSLSASLSIVPWQEDSFLISLRTREKAQQVYRVSRENRDGKVSFSLQESITFPKNSQEPPLLLPISATGGVFALHTQDATRIALTPMQEEAPPVLPQEVPAPKSPPGRVELTPTQEKVFVSLRLPPDPKSSFVAVGEAGTLSRYADAVSYYELGPKQNEPQIAVLWLGNPPFGKNGAQLSLARTSPEGTLREKPLRILPGENIRAADMAVLDESGLRFGVFYQHQNPEVGLGFVQIDCSK